VQEITKDAIHLADGRRLPYGLAVWAAGNGPLPLTLQITNSLGQSSPKGGRMAIDPWLRAVGSDGSILALGDCASSTDNPLPATAQVALQQGEFLALLLNKQFDLSVPTVVGEAAKATTIPPARIPGVTKIGLSDRIASLSTGTTDYFKPFQFFNLGILAYLGGDSALAQLTPVPGGPAVKGTGFLGNEIWRGVYLYKQASWRNRLLVVGDWFRRRLFGRDITMLD